MQDGILARHASEMIAGMRGIIPGGISVRDFTAVTGFSNVISREILDGLASLGIGTKRDNMYHFGDADRLKTAIELLRYGSPIQQVSEAIDWRDFEGLVAEILNDKGFAVMKNMMLAKPRMEIDVVGIRLGIAMLVDCKHWSRYSNHALASAVKKQVGRTRQYVSKTRGSMAVPVIVTLDQDRLSFIDRVPIVPIPQFSSFVDEFYGNLDDIQTIGTGQ